MFDLGMGELLVVGVVALIVIGPKDLPGMFHSMGRFTAKMRTMAREFSRAMDQAAKESGVGDVAKDLKAATSPSAMGLDRLRDAADRFEKWDPVKAAAKPAPAAPPTPPPMPGAVVPSAGAPAAPVVAVGPQTKALAEQQAARAAIARDAAEKMRAVPAEAPADPAPTPAPAVRKPGRVRAKKPAEPGDPA